jgi:hypothetical protein
MSTPACGAPLTLEQLLDYLHDELDAESEQKADEHLLACDRCSQLLGEIVAMAEGVRRIVGSGGVDAVLTRSFLERLKSSGVRVREYELAASAEVLCTITPDDDLVVARLHAPLGDVERLDVLVENPEGYDPDRLEDVPFDPAAGEIVLAPQSAALRSLGDAVQHVQLVAVDDTGERLLGTYTFNHSPHRP